MFGGFFNRTQFNRGLIQTSLAVTFASKSEVSADSQRIRYPNYLVNQPNIDIFFNRMAFNRANLSPRYKGTLNSESLLEAKPLVYQSASTIFSSESKLVATPTKSLFGEINFESNAELVATPFKYMSAETAFRANSSLTTNFIRERYPNYLVNQADVQALFNRMAFNRDNIRWQGTLNGVSFFDSKLTVQYNSSTATTFNSNAELVVTPFKYMSTKTAFRANSSLTTNFIRERYPNYLVNQADVQALFNRMAFNRGSIRWPGTLNGTSFLKSKLTISYDLKMTYTAKASLYALPYKFTIAKAEFKGNSCLIATLYQNMILRSTLIGKSDFLANGSLFSVETLTLSNLGFKPGDVIVIDLCNFFITKNGIDITYLFDGDFFKLYPDINTLIWQDDKLSRNIKMEILYQNKFL